MSQHAFDDTISIQLTRPLPQLRNLRDTIPRVMESVLVDPVPPEQFQSHFIQSATGAAAEIKRFAQIMENGRSKDAMGKAKESKAKNGEDITGWLVVEHEDWLDAGHDVASEDVDIEGEASGKKVFTAESTSGDVQTILEKFKESHPSIEVSLDDTTGTVKVWVIEKAVRSPFMLLGLSTSTSRHSFRSPTQHQGRRGLSSL